MKIVTEQPLFEIVLRKYEISPSTKERDVVKRLCLSLGLLQPGDSRDVVVDILHVLLKSRSRRRLLSISEIENKVVQNRKLHRLTLAGIAASNVRRQIKRLRNLLIVDKVKSRYRISEFMSLKDLFREKIEGSLLPNILRRIHAYVQKTDEIFMKPAVSRQKNQNI